MPSSIVIAFIVKFIDLEICINTFKSDKDSFPPYTATTTSYSLWIILYFDIVFAVFLTREFVKHSEQRFSPEYFLENTAVLLHQSHFIVIFCFHLNGDKARFDC